MTSIPRVRRHQRRRPESEPAFVAEMRRDRDPGVIPVAACLGRPRKAADAVDRKRVQTRDRQRRRRRRQNGDRHVFKVSISVVVDYAKASELVDQGFLAEWDMEDRAAVQAAVQKQYDTQNEYE
jgi:hypothetical protein